MQKYRSSLWQLDYQKNLLYKRAEFLFREICLLDQCLEERPLEIAVVIRNDEGRAIGATHAHMASLLPGT